MELDLVQLISEIGFPIAVVIYLFWRDTKKMDILIDLVKELKNTVEKLCQDVRNPTS